MVIKRGWLILGLFVMFVVVDFCKAQEDEKGIWERDSLTNGFFGLNERLADSGLELRLLATQMRTPAAIKQ